MNGIDFEKKLIQGEGISIEFKRCGNGIQSDTYESVCAFLNRFGGDLFLGMLDNGTVAGIPESAVADVMRNFVKTICNPDLMSPTVYLSPETIEYEGKTVVHVHVPPSSEIHSWKNVVYDRIDDSDVKVTATGAKAQLYIRKQGIFTEQRIYRHVRMEDLRLDLLPQVRQMAANNAGGSHPWVAMSDEELLRSARLIGRDPDTGEEGVKLAGIMLLGRDELILDVCPAYATDALLRKVNTDRYDDRDYVQTNLIEAYDRLVAFAAKHLLDKFYLEDGIQRVSLSGVLAREMVSNTLMHREFTSTYRAKLVIERDRMYTENACRASKVGEITPDNLDPDPKNPTIASFFRVIGRADSLGSGVRNLFKYSRRYSGVDPEIVEDDVFRTVVPLEDGYTDDGSIEPEPAITGDKPAITGDKPALGIASAQEKLMAYVDEHGDISPSEAQSVLGLKASRTREVLSSLCDAGLLERIGAKRNSRYVRKR